MPEESVLLCKRRPLESVLAHTLSATEEEVEGPRARPVSSGMRSENMQTHLENSLVRFS